jgi:hypothetical protein
MQRLKLQTTRQRLLTLALFAGLALTPVSALAQDDPDAESDTGSDFAAGSEEGDAEEDMDDDDGASSAADGDITPLGARDTDEREEDEAKRSRIDEAKRAGGDAGEAPEAGAAGFDGTIENPEEGKSPVLGNFMDTRLSFSFSDDNWLAGPGQTTPSSPSVDFFPRSNNQLFFDNLNRRDSGFETLSHMVLHRRQRGFIPGMDTEGAIVSRFIWFADDETGRSGTTFRDDGSYIRMRYFFNGSTKDENAANLDLVMFPFNTNRFRLGYLYDISWGGLNIFPAKGIAAPGAKLQLKISDGYAFIGAKTARLLDENINEIESNWGGLAGAGWDFADLFAVDFGGGYFRRGTNPLVGVEGQPVDGFGGSTRLTFHWGRRVPGSIDFRLYRTDPALMDLFKVARKGKKGMSFLAALEYSHLEQTLQDPETPTSTVLQGANAAALSLKFQYDNLALNADGIWRDLAFILYERPSFVPFQDFPRESVMSPEVLGSFSVSYFLEDLHLTPGAVLGVQMPATFTGLLPGTVVDSGAPDLAGSQTVVVRNIGSVDILPCAERAEDGGCNAPATAVPIYAARFALKWDVSEIMAIVAETTFFLDNNETDLVDSEGGLITRQFVSTVGDLNLRVAGGLFAQARF